MFFFNSCGTAKLKKELSTLQKQATMKRKIRINKNWQPLSLLNEDYKIISKALASRLKRSLLIYFYRSNQHISKIDILGKVVDW